MRPWVTAIIEGMVLGWCAGVVIVAIAIVLIATGVIPTSPCLDPGAAQPC